MSLPLLVLQGRLSGCGHWYIEMCPYEEEQIAREMIIKKSGDVKYAGTRMYVRIREHSSLPLYWHD